MPKQKLNAISKIQLWMLVATVVAMILAPLVNFLWVLGTWLIVMYLLVRLLLVKEELERSDEERKRIQYLVEHPDETVADDRAPVRAREQ
jgi:hypothetical protein